MADGSRFGYCLGLRGLVWSALNIAVLVSRHNKFVGYDDVNREFGGNTEGNEHGT